MRNILGKFSDIFLAIGDWVGSIDDIITFIGLVIVVVTFIEAVAQPLIRPLRAFLKEYGVPAFEPYRIIWKCRSQPKLYLRLYIESFILFYAEFYRTKAKGDSERMLWPLQRERFSQQIKTFGRTGEFVIKVDTVSDLIADETISMIAKYFSCLDGTAGYRRFWKGSNRDEDKLKKDAFCSKVSVSNGYFAPISRIFGLNDRYESNWRDILKNYSDTCDGSYVPDQAISYTYTWLMWGPSIQTSRPDGKSDLSLGIYGCVDEANSFYVSVPSRIHEKIAATGGFSQAGVIYGRICNPLPYVLGHAGSFEETASPFLDKLRDKYRDTNEFIFEVDDFDAAEDEDKYFTAYVWGMFLMCEGESEESAEFDFSRAVVAFEHYNLAGGKDISFANTQLVNKLKSLFNKIGKPGYIFRYCAAMNSDTGAALRKALQSRNDVSFDRTYSFSGILDSIDKHCASMNWQLLDSTEYGCVVDLFGRSFSEEGKDYRKELRALMMALSEKGREVIAIKDIEGNPEAALIVKKNRRNEYRAIRCIAMPNSDYLFSETELKSLSDREIRNMLSLR